MALKLLNRTTINGKVQNNRELFIRILYNEFNLKFEIELL